MKCLDITSHVTSLTPIAVTFCSDHGWFSSLTAGVPVLIRDDEEDVRNIAIRSLGELGCQAQECCNGQEAVELDKSRWESGAVLPVVILYRLIPGGMDRFSLITSVKPLLFWSQRFFDFFYVKPLDNPPIDNKGWRRVDF